MKTILYQNQMHLHFKKSIFLGFCLLCFFSLPAQNKLLSIEETVQVGPLSPTSLRNLTGTITEGEYFFTGAVSGKEILIRGNFLTKKTDTIGTTGTIAEGAKNFYSIKPNPKGGLYLFSAGKIWEWKTGQAKATLLYTLEDEAENDEFEPFTGKTAYTKGQNIFLKTQYGVTPVTKETEEGIECGKTVHRSEYGITKGLFWSPKGNFLAYYKMDERMVTPYPFTLINSLPAKNKYEKYPMAGQKSHEVTVHVFNPANLTTVVLETGEPKEQYLTNVTWSPDEKEVWIAVLNRETNHMKLNRYDAQSGKFIAMAFEEKHEKYVEPENGPLFTKANPGKFIWQSERDGSNQLYLYENSGKLIRQLTKGPSVVTDVAGYDAGEDKVIYQVSENDGMDFNWYAASLSSGKTTRITQLQGDHNAQLHPTGKAIFDYFQNPSTPRIIQAVNLSGKVLHQLHESKNPLADYKLPEMQVVKIKTSDSTVLNARILKPINFDASKKYPVIVYLYGGPHAQMIKNTWLYGASHLLLHWAQKGFVVFTIDNRGSSNRTLTFEQATYRQLGKVEIEDQLLGLEYLKKQGYIDEQRIGVHGWSFGGYMAASLMTKTPGAYKCGIAGAPVIDWKMYEIMYTERYMDTPEENKEGYEKANVLNYAKNLKGKLLVIHGTADDVVVNQHTQTLVQKCIEAGTDLDYFIYPGHKHGIGGKDRIHLHKKMTRYFTDNL